VTIAKRPSLVARDGRTSKTDLPVGESGIFFRNGLDRRSGELPDGQITGHETIDVCRGAKTDVKNHIRF
jgi:hypothetical protein